jgi:hypothetical protein
LILLIKVITGSLLPVGITSKRVLVKYLKWN